MFSRRNISAGLVYFSSILMVVWVGLYPDFPFWPRMAVLGGAILAAIGTTVTLYSDRS